MLTLPKGVDDFYVYCDASITCLGVVLMNQGRVIVYASRHLKPHVVQYMTHDLDRVVVFTLSISRHYLYGY